MTRGLSARRGLYLEKAFHPGCGVRPGDRRHGLTYGKLRQELSPLEDRGYFLTLINAPEGASMEYTDGYVRAVERMYAEVPEIRSMFAVVAPGLERPNPVNFGVTFAQLAPWEERERKTQQITAVDGAAPLGGAAGRARVPGEPQLARPGIPHAAGAVRDPGQYLRRPRRLGQQAPGEDARPRDRS